MRNWKLSSCEGAVADDEAGKVYIAEQSKGVWEVGAEPDDAAPGKLVIKVGENDLRGDVEGVALYHLPGGKGYLLLSDQGSSVFRVYDLTGAHPFIGTFAIKGAVQTDEIDVANINLGTEFPKGLFACHQGGRPILLTPWESIAQALRPELRIDTSWNPPR